ncbi:MAG: DNA cytosine methyltransferase [Rhodocyclaceae bacterium]|nr:DNA cytosine methyltransferase [Rhodocyclaceae bacterium]
MTTTSEILHAHLFCGLGGGAQGFNRGQARVGNLVGKFRCIGGIDSDAAAIRDFTRAAGVRGTVMDLFDRDQYIAFHGNPPPADWVEATPADIRRAMGGERPNIWFLSAPCKGFSGLLAEGKSKTDKYQALNRLTLRGMWLALEAYAADPVEMFVFENVPRIATRGRHLLDQIGDLLRAYGYAVAETTHDCGEIGGLAQSRRRFLLVARHVEKVPPFLYEPPKRALRSVGEVLGRLPLPGDPAAGPMHRIPNLQWKTWVRLAFVEAGSDWRSLNKLAVEDGALRDFLIVPGYHHGYMGVNAWNDSMGTVTGRSSPTTGAFGVADPRFDQSAKWQDGQAYGVCGWDDTSGAITGQKSPGQGAFSIADPRMPDSVNRQNGIYRVVKWDRSSHAVTGAAHVAGAALSVADPRPTGNAFGRYPVTPWGAPSGTVISGSTTGLGAFAVADPRPGNIPQPGDHYLTGGHYGVVPWQAACGAVSASACHDNGRWSVADPRADHIGTATDMVMPTADQKLVAIIRALDGTWHRPMTTLDMAALQSLYDPDDEAEAYDLHGSSDSDKRERIGNAVPPKAAEAIAGVIGQTILLARSGETFALGSTPIWVRPVAIALSVAQGGGA